MAVSFWHSADAGVRWNPVVDTAYQYMGTGGGAFDPLTANVAFLDYWGRHAIPISFVSLGGGTRFTPLGELSCSNASPLIFSSEREGLVMCSVSSGTSIQLRRTIDGGATWTVVWTTLEN